MAAAGRDDRDDLRRRAPHRRSGDRPCPLAAGEAATDFGTPRCARGCRSDPGRFPRPATRPRPWCEGPDGPRVASGRVEAAGVYLRRDRREGGDAETARPRDVRGRGVLPPGPLSRLNKNHESAKQGGRKRTAVPSPFLPPCFPYGCTYLERFAAACSGREGEAPAEPWDT